MKWIQGERTLNNILLFQDFWTLWLFVKFEVLLCWWLCMHLWFFHVSYIRRCFYMFSRDFLIEYLLFWRGIWIKSIDSVLAKGFPVLGSIGYAFPAVLSVPHRCTIYIKPEFDRAFGELARFYWILMDQVYKCWRNFVFECAFFAENIMAAIAIHCFFR